jgi:hypothetical protein
MLDVCARWREDVSAPLEPPMMAHEAARLLAGRRRVVERPCEFCGKPIVGTKRRKYCSPSCANKAWMRAHPDYPAQRRARRHAQRQALKPATPSTDTAAGPPTPTS